MQIAGRTCVACGKGITFSADGKCCPSCGAAVHQACESRDTCRRCGQGYEKYRPPTVDPARDAVLPRELRKSTTAVSGAFAIFGAVLLFLFLLLMLLWFHH